MAGCKCAYCNREVVEIPFDDVVCPKCSSPDASGWMFDCSSSEEVVVDWRCGRCGHVWSGRYVLPKELLANF